MLGFEPGTLGTGHWKHIKVEQEKLNSFLDGENPQTMDIVEMAIHPVVCQKSDFQNSQNIDPLQMPAKNFRPKYACLSKIFCCKNLIHGALQK